MARARILLVLVGLLAAALPHGVRAQAGLVGILEGRATLLRQTTRLELAEGALLKGDDIVETTSAGSFVQIELADGTRVGLGADTRLLLAPGALRRGAAAPRLYLLQGWAKITPAADARPTGAVDLTPTNEVATGSGPVILSATPKEFAAFAESGSLRLTARPGARRPPLTLGAGDFMTERPGDKPVLASRPAAAFLDAMPRPFRDPLPARAERFKGRQITLKALGEVGYDDIAPWLTAEIGLRTALLPRWRPRLHDKAFRDAVVAHMAAHPEWDPVVFPEKLAARKPRERPPQSTAPTAPEAASATAAH